MFQAIHFSSLCFPHRKSRGPAPCRRAARHDLFIVLILSKVLPLNAVSACNMSAVVRGIEMRSMPSPLHSLHLEWASDGFLSSSGVC